MRPRTTLPASRARQRSPQSSTRPAICPARRRKARSSPRTSGGARVVLQGAAATPDAVLAALKGKTYWHFASHGAFSWEDARGSALVMHGLAPLTVGRLLETDGLGRPRLVVLSACETGLYDIRSNPDEFVGPARHIHRARGRRGARHLWPVSDAATALLIAKFYELHLGGGLSPPTALRRAQAWLREASSEDLASYAKVAAARGRLERRRLAEIERDLSADGLRRSRNSALVEWVKPDATKTKGMKAAAPASQSRGPTLTPISGRVHPYGTLASRPGD